MQQRRRGTRREPILARDPAPVAAMPAAAMRAALLGATLVSQLDIVRLLAPLGPRVLQLQWSRDARVFREVMGSWTPADRARYRAHLLPDTVHPLLYAACLAMSGAHLARTARPGNVRLRLAAIAAPVAAAALDLAENAWHARFLGGRSHVTDAAVRRSGTVTRAKWVLAALSLAALAVNARRVRRGVA